MKVPCSVCNEPWPHDDAVVADRCEKITAELASGVRGIVQALRRLSEKEND